jgi:hypothetical protein
MLYLCSLPGRSLVSFERDIREPVVSTCSITLIYSICDNLGVYLLQGDSTWKLSFYLPTMQICQAMAS